MTYEGTVIVELLESHVHHDIALMIYMYLVRVLRLDHFILPGSAIFRQYLHFNHIQFWDLSSFVLIVHKNDHVPFMLSYREQSEPLNSTLFHMAGTWFIDQNLIWKIQNASGRVICHPSGETTCLCMSRDGHWRLGIDEKENMITFYYSCSAFCFNMYLHDDKDNRKESANHDKNELWWRSFRCRDRCSYYSSFQCGEWIKTIEASALDVHENSVLYAVFIDAKFTIHLMTYSAEKNKMHLVCFRNEAWISQVANQRIRNMRVAISAMNHYGVVFYRIGLDKSHRSLVFEFDQEFESIFFRDATEVESKSIETTSKKRKK